MLSYGQQEFKKRNFSKALFWYNRVLANEYDFDISNRKNLMTTNFADDPYLIGLTFNQIACAADVAERGGWYWVNNAKLFLSKVNIQHPQYKSAQAMLSALKKDRFLCTEREIREQREREEKERKEREERERLEISSAIYLYDSKRYYEAISTLNQIIKLNPYNSEAYYYRGMSRMQLTYFIPNNEKDRHSKTRFFGCYDYKKAVSLSPGRYEWIESWLKMKRWRYPYSGGGWCKYGTKWQEEYKLNQYYMSR